MNEAKSANQSRGSSENPKRQRSGTRWRFLPKSASSRRLLASINAYGLERRGLENWVPCHDANATGDSRPSPPAKEEQQKVSCAAEKLLDQAKMAVQKWWADRDSGYACFLAAQRIDILSFDESRVRAAARSLLDKANGDKIKGWRKEAIVCLLPICAVRALHRRVRENRCALDRSGSRAFVHSRLQPAIGRLRCRNRHPKGTRHFPDWRPRPLTLNYAAAGSQSGVSPDWLIVPRSRSPAICS